MSPRSRERACTRRTGAPASHSWTRSPSPWPRASTRSCASTSREAGAGPRHERPARPNGRRRPLLVGPPDPAPARPRGRHDHALLGSQRRVDLRGGGGPRPLPRVRGCPVRRPGRRLGGGRPGRGPAPAPPGRTPVRGYGIALTAVAVTARALPYDTVVLASAAAVGVGLPCVLIAALTAVQRETPDALLGRTTATANTLLFAPTAVGLALGAGLVELVDHRVLLALTSGCRTTRHGRRTVAVPCRKRGRGTAGTAPPGPAGAGPAVGHRRTPQTTGRASQPREHLRHERQVRVGRQPRVIQPHFGGAELDRPCHVLDECAGRPPIPLTTVKLAAEQRRQLRCSAKGISGSGAAGARYDHSVGDRQDVPGVHPDVRTDAVGDRVRVQQDLEAASGAAARTARTASAWRDRATESRHARVAVASSAPSSFSTSSQPSARASPRHTGSRARRHRGRQLVGVEP